METKNVIREMSMCEMMDANGGGFFFSSASTWFWRGLALELLPVVLVLVLP